jgi:hypothetical protein
LLWVNPLKPSNQALLIKQAASLRHLPVMIIENDDQISDDIMTISITFILHINNID